MIHPLRVVLAEDNAAYRRALREMLESAGALEVVGEAADGAEAVRLAATLRPHVVVMDLRMPDSNGVRHEHVGLGAIEEIAGAHPDVSIVVLSSTGDDYLRSRASRLGARSYLVKDSDRRTVIGAVRSAALGGPLPPS